MVCDGRGDGWESCSYVMGEVWQSFNRCRYLRKMVWCEGIQVMGRENGIVWSGAGTEWQRRWFGQPSDG